MKPSLAPGLELAFRYVVPPHRTVPFVYPESDLFRPMPQVFATAYLVGLFEWACMEAIRQHLDPGESTVGTDVRVSHTAATPPGLTVTVHVRVEKVDGRRISFQVAAHDGVDAIGEGTHQRSVIDPYRFTAKVRQKAAAAGHPPAEGPVLVDAPVRVEAAGTPPKLIEEFVGRVRTGTEPVSIARMTSPGGWREPAQTPDFDEYTLVLRGALQVETRAGVLEVGAGQAVHTRRGEWVRYATPGAEGAEYLAVCLPAFSPDTVHREDG
jgi:predicted thioesterase/quercetin dioxygenase-like cupin family protein